MNSLPDLTIAIPTFNRPNELREALTTIQQEVGLLSNRVEVVVSDNAPTPEIAEMVGRFAGLTVRYFGNERNVGGSGNVLLACERSRGTYVMLHADDDLLCAGSLSRLLSAIANMPHTSVMASPLGAFEGHPENVSEKLRFPSEGVDMILKSGAEALSGLFLRACSLSGLVVRRNLLDIAGAGAINHSNYPQIYLVGNAAKKADALYMAKPLMKIRLEEVKRWNYSGDFMSRAILDILGELTRDEPWGTGVRRKITRKRIWAAYGPLYTARGRSWGSFIKVASGFASVREYRRHILFWFLVTGIGALGPAGIDLVRRVWQGHTVR